MMDPMCYYNGSCVLCGCMTTMLQMANKGCERCYQPMLSKKKWNAFKKGETIIYKNKKFKYSDAI